MDNEFIANLSMQNLIINIVTVTVVMFISSFIFKRVYKNKKKVDKGFVLSYFKLSYRRKLIRNLWQLPPSIILLIALIIILDISTTASVILLSLYILAGLTHCILLYRKWKQEESSPEM